MGQSDRPPGEVGDIDRRGLRVGLADLQAGEEHRARALGVADQVDEAVHALGVAHHPGRRAKPPAVVGQARRVGQPADDLRRGGRVRRPAGQERGGEAGAVGGLHQEDLHPPGGSRPPAAFHGGAEAPAVRELPLLGDDCGARAGAAARARRRRFALRRGFDAAFAAPAGALQKAEDALPRRGELAAAPVARHIGADRGRRGERRPSGPDAGRRAAVSRGKGMRRRLPGGEGRGFRSGLG